MNQLRTVVKKFTQEIKAAHEKTVKNKHQYHITNERIHLISQLDLSEMKDNPYIDERIKTYITNNSNYRKQLYIEGKLKITIIDEYAIPNHYFYHILDLYYFIIPYADSSCNKTLHITIHLTPFKKLLPNKSDIIGPFEVNSGSTRICTAEAAIFIWRKEEWFKVLIHECFHYFQLDYDHHISAVTDMKLIFPIESDFLMGEVYSETWATILHTIFYAFYKQLNCFSLLQKERSHSIKQTIHILQHMNLTYNDIIFNPSDKYKENSNVFCYYIAKMICLSEINEYIQWFPIEKSNKSTKSTKSTKSKHSIPQFLQKYFNNNALIKEIDKVEWLPYSLKMCHFTIL